VNRWDFLGQFPRPNPPLPNNEGIFTSDGMGGYFDPEGGWIPRDKTDCWNLLVDINELAREVSQRELDLRQDVKYLYETKPTGQFSYEGHRIQMDGKKRRLKRLMDEYNSKNCDRWRRLPQEAWRSNGLRLPEKPDRHLQTDPESAYNNGVLVYGGAAVAVGGVAYGIYCLTPAGWVTTGGILLFGAAAAAN
jgi:hypothetical protein